MISKALLIGTTIVVGAAWSPALAEDIYFGDRVTQHLRSSEGVEVRIIALEVWRGRHGLSGEYGYEDVQIRLSGVGVKPTSQVQVVAVTSCRDGQANLTQPDLVETQQMRCSTQTGSCESSFERFPRYFWSRGGTPEYSCSTELAFSVDGSWQRDPLGARPYRNFLLSLNPVKDDGDE